MDEPPVFEYGTTLTLEVGRAYWEQVTWPKDTYIQLVSSPKYFHCPGLGGSCNAVHLQCSW
jgi:hypothetical protein